MKKSKFGKFLTILIIAAIIFAVIYFVLPGLFGSSEETPIIEDGGKGGTTTTAVDMSDYSELLQNITPEAKKPYTIMVYMNGADLESKYGCATSDLVEMANSNFNTDNVNLLVITGGTRKWQNNLMTTDTAIYRIQGQDFEPLANLGRITMADTGLLAAYTDYCMTAYPADKYGFIFWNHGGGTLYGYGSDELFGNAGLSITQISDAFGASKAAETPFEFIGYDCCLMATIETAHKMSPYASYFIASEEAEPGYGWDYNWLKTLGNNPTCSGAEIGVDIVDRFVAFYNGSGEQATLSVMDLSKLEDFSSKLDAFSLVGADRIKQGNYNTIAKARKNSKSFGYSGENQMNFDLVDIYSLASNLSGYIPAESKALMSSLDDFVVYCKNSDTVRNAHGVSTYLPYSTKSVAVDSANAYSTMRILPGYTEFLVYFTSGLTGARIARDDVEEAVPASSPDGEVHVKIDPDTLDQINSIELVIWRQLEENSDYFVKLGVFGDVEVLSDGTITTMFDGYWATLGGRVACFYEADRAGDTVLYATPALLNGEEVNIFVVFGGDYPDGKILGAMPAVSSSNMSAKYLVPIETGDKIALKFFAQLMLADEADAAKYSTTETWLAGDEFTVDRNFAFEVQPVGSELYLYGFYIEDTQNNSYYTDFIEIRY